MKQILKIVAIAYTTLSVSAVFAQDSQLGPEKYNLSCHVREQMNKKEEVIFSKTEFVEIPIRDGSKLSDMEDASDSKNQEFDVSIISNRSGLVVKLKANLSVTRRVIRFNGLNRVSRFTSVNFSAELPSTGVTLKDTSALLNPFEANQFGDVGSTGASLYFKGLNTQLGVYCGIDRPQD